MQIAVVIEPVAGNGYRARGDLLGLSAEGATPDDALAKLRAQVQERLQNGTQVVPLELAEDANPWVEFAGMFKDDPMFEEVEQIMAANRERDEADADYP